MCWLTVILDFGSDVVELCKMQVYAVSFAWFSSKICTCGDSFESRYGLALLRKAPLSCQRMQNVSDSLFYGIGLWGLVTIGPFCIIEAYLLVVLDFGYLCHLCECLCAIYFQCFCSKIQISGSHLWNRIQGYIVDPP